MRRELLASRDALPAATRAEGERALATHLQRWVLSRFPTLHGCGIAVYWPIRGEPDLRSLWAQWSAQGAVLALPVVDAQARPLRFVRWTPGERLNPGRYGIPEPQGTELSEPQLIIAPCVGFDDDGYRLGYGGGYYDRTLARWALPDRLRPLVLGVAWNEARLCDFKPEATDIAMDAVITPAGLVAPQDGNPRRLDHCDRRRP
jgi:5,10-methenyltetrahydrofolate synthetase